MLILMENTDQPSTSKKKTNPTNKNNPSKKEQSALDLENIQNALHKVSNEVVELKKNLNEG